MKKFFKFSVACLLVICSCFTFVACGSNKDDGDDKAAVNEANYIVLKSSAAKTANVNNYNSGVTATDTAVMSMSVSMAMPEETPEDDGASVTAQADEDEGATEIPLMSESEATRTIVSYNKTAQKGYIRRQSLPSDEGDGDMSEMPEISVMADDGAEPETPATPEWRDEEVKYFEKKDDNYNVYVNYGGEAYAKYLADASSYVNLSQAIGEFSFNEMFAGYDTYADLVKDVKDSITDTMAMELPFDDAQTNVTFTEKDGVYTLAIAIDYSAEDVEIEGMTFPSVVVDVDGSIVFDSQKVRSSNISMLISCSMSGSLEDIMGDMMDEGDELPPTGDPAEDTITVNMSMAVGYSFELDENYNADLEPEVDTDKAVDLGNLPISVEFYIDGYYYSQLSDVETGNDVEEKALQGIVSYAKTPENIKWYLDEACTQEFTATKYPSYNLKLYIKNVELSDGYAYVRMVNISRSDLAGETPTEAEIAEMLEWYENIYIVPKSLPKVEGYRYILNGVDVTDEKDENDEPIKTITFVNRISVLIIVSPESED